MATLKDKSAADHRRRGLTTGLIAMVMLLLFATYANLRWTNETPAFEKAKETADTPAYLRVSGEAFLSKEFWANARPPMFPLLLKIYAADKIKVASFQTAFSIFAWGMLALSLSYSLKGLLRPIAFGLILALSLDRHIAGWDVVMLTESLSISLLVLFLAAWFWLLRGWSWGKVFMLSLVALPWAFTRDTNGWILLMVAGLILLGVLFFKARKRYLVVAFVFALIFALSNLSANRGHRWVFPFQNVLAQRDPARSTGGGVFCRLRYAGHAEVARPGGRFCQQRRARLLSRSDARVLSDVVICQWKIMLHALAIFQAVDQPAPALDGFRPLADLRRCILFLSAAL